MKVNFVRTERQFLVPFQSLLDFVSKQNLFSSTGINIINLSLRTLFISLGSLVGESSHTRTLFNCNGADAFDNSGTYCTTKKINRSKDFYRIDLESSTPLRALLIAFIQVKDLMYMPRLGYHTHMGSFTLCNSRALDNALRTNSLF